MILCRIPGKNTTFRRTIGDRVLRFEPGQPVECDQTEVEAVAVEIGRKLVVLKEDSDFEQAAGNEGMIRFLVDDEKTSERFAAGELILKPSQKRAIVVKSVESTENEDVSIDDATMEKLVLPENLKALGAETAEDVTPDLIESFLGGGKQLEDLKQIGKVTAESIKKAIGYED